jgi:outer membrane protein OmpA-like peptidoglycan-associated protein
MKKASLVLALAAASICGNAQTVENAKFTDNWSVELKGGAATPLSHSAFWGDMRGVIGLDLKKEITPVVGVGIEGEWSVNTSGICRNVHSSNVFDHQLVGAFGTINFMNLFGGYKGTPRVFEIEGVAGLGWLHTYMTGDGDNNGWYNKFGANLNFNLGESRAWTIGVKPAVVFDMEKLNGSDNHNVNRAYLELLAGVTYHFKNSNGKHHFTLCDKVATQAEVDALNDEINNLRQRLANTPEKVVEEVVTNNNVVEKTVLNNTIGFNLNSSKVSENQYTTLASIAQWMNENPNENVDVIGYADKATGTEDYNQKLSEKRAQNVKDILVNKFGVSESRLTAKGLGSSEQPYDSNNWNRVVIFKAQ